MALCHKLLNSFVVVYNCSQSNALLSIIHRKFSVCFNVSLSFKLLLLLLTSSKKYNDMSSVLVSKTLAYTIKFEFLCMGSGKVISKQSVQKRRQN